VKSFDVIAAAVLVVGGLNWGLWGLFEVDLVATLFGGNTALLAKLIYILVGFSAAYQAVAIKSIQRRWSVVPAID